jgi:hypothetical protein
VAKKKAQTFDIFIVDVSGITSKSMISYKNESKFDYIIVKFRKSISPDVFLDINYGNGVLTPGSQGVYVEYGSSRQFSIIPTGVTVY